MVSFVGCSFFDEPWSGLKVGTNIRYQRSGPKVRLTSREQGLHHMVGYGSTV